MFKEKDEVVILSRTFRDSHARNHSGETYTIVRLYDERYHDSWAQYTGPLWELRTKDGLQTYEFQNQLKLNNHMSIKDSFALAFKNEPEKSFRKVGITNGDDFLTADGQSIFLSWLLKLNGEAFKKEVVDDLLAEQEKSKA